ncbi:MAG: phosphate ABC transporter permease subunit PstC [Clostridia bacterium]|nr:phosphate ABC transporter permease subunit PstC [Clostridia bacterium]
MTKIREKAMHAVFLFSACIAIFGVLMICIFLFAEGIPALREIGVFKFVFGKVWNPSADEYGVLPMILGSIYVTAGALVIGVPVGILTSVYLAMLCPVKLYRIIRPLIDILAGVPSVILGLFGITVVVPAVRSIFGGWGSSILAASVVLSIMILPTVISVAESSLRALPTSYFEGALALGATRERGAFSVMLPAASSGVAAAVVLGTGRAIGETMAVIMVAGNQSVMPSSIIKGVRTLTANIAIEMGYAAGLHRDALVATGVVLFVFILLLNLLFSALTRRRER